MYLTGFTPFFVLLVLISFWGIPQWTAMTLIAAFFQAASPLLLMGGGRASGLAPSYALLFVGFLHFISKVLRSDRNKSHLSLVYSPAFLWLLAFTIIGVTGAILLPHLFTGFVRVLSPRFGLDTGFTESLHPSSGNFIQAFYLICNFILFFLMSYFVSNGDVTLDKCLRAIAIGACISGMLGVYQIISHALGLPWPDSIINSNIGIRQLAQQTTLGVSRMSATFTEPSVMALHFLCAFALFGLGLRRYAIGALLFMCLLISTSSSAYIGLMLIVCVWGVLEFSRVGLRIIPGFMFFVFMIVCFYSADAILNHGRIVESFITHKLAGASGSARIGADYIGLKAMIGTFGLGVGVGSTRTSSFLVTLAATVGIPGLFCFFGFMGTLLLSSFRNFDTDRRALGLGLIGVLIGWMLSVPDLVIPIAWAIAGIIHGHLRASVAPADKRSSYGLTAAGVVS